VTSLHRWVPVKKLRNWIETVGHSWWKVVWVIWVEMTGSVLGVIEGVLGMVWAGLGVIQGEPVWMDGVDTLSWGASGNGTDD